MTNQQTVLDHETQLLVALGSAVAAGCIPCLHNITDMSRKAGIDEKKLRAAAMTGQYLKEQPANLMKSFSDELLGTHLQSVSDNIGGGCPMASSESDAASIPISDDSLEKEGCGCG